MTTGRRIDFSALADLTGSSAVSRWVPGDAGGGLHVLDYPSRSEQPARTVVLVPGITMPAYGMDFVARPLAENRRVLVLDVRGRGLSQAGSSYTLPDYARDLAAVCEQLNLGDAVFVGHSMGARVVAAALAEGMPAAGSVIIDPPTSGPGRDPYPTTAETFLGQLHESYRGTTAEDVARSWPSWPAREQSIRARWLPTCDATAIEETHRGFETEDFFPYWEKVSGATVFIRGGDSPVVPESIMDEVKAANPAATYLEVPAAGHMVFWDSPEAAEARLSEALATIG